MNESPVPPFQPDQSQSTSVRQPALQSLVHPSSQQGSQVMSIWSLALGISALLLGLLFFISIPAAITAIILGIIVLAKHRIGRGKAIAGIVTGGLALLFIPVLVSVALVTYNGLTDKANGINSASLQQEISKLGIASSDGTSVNTPCFSYTIPAGYVYDKASQNCTTAINIPNGDSLTRITVKGNTGTIGSLQDVVAMFNTTLKNGDSHTAGVIDHEQLTVNNRPAYYVSYKDANGLLFGNYIIPDTSASQKDENGKTITAYTVAGYTYNSSLKDLVRSVLDSLTIK